MTRTNATTRIPARYTLTDEDGTRPVALGEFVAYNDLEPAEVNAIAMMDVGDSVPFGGGACPVVTLTRIE